MLKNKTIFFICLTIIVLLLAYFLDSNDTQFSWHDILVEFHGLIFDLIILGIILTVYENFKDKKDRIERYQEEIDDFRFWKSDEAKFRIIGNVKRLYDLGITKFNLMHCELKNGDLKEYNFTDSNFYFANLSYAELQRTNLSNCKIGLCDLSFTYLVETNLSNADSLYSCYDSSKITNCNFSNAILKKSIFDNATIINTIFFNADMNEVSLKMTKIYNQNWFEELDQQNVLGLEYIKANFFIDIDDINEDDNGQYWFIKQKKLQTSLEL